MLKTSNFSLSSGSNLSGSLRIAILTPEEVGETLHLSSQTVKWLKNEPFNEKEPLLILEFKVAFFNYGNFEQNKDFVFNALISNGATHVNGNVFKFEDWTTFYSARDQMEIDIPWAFYSLNGGGLMTNGQLIPVNQQPTIQTTVVTWFPEQTGKLSIQPYEFFKL